MIANTPARVCIADDEALARAKLRRLLDGEADFELVGESADGRDAVQAIGTLKPDVLFLDVEMPELSGFEALHALPWDVRPLIVFVTAFDHYALQAFDVQATDYLLKPFGAVRFQVTLTRVREWLARRPGREAFLERVSVPSRRGVDVIAFADVEWIEADDNYVRLHHRAGRSLLREPLTRLLEQLDPRQFARVHRGAAVNVGCVATVRTGASGDATVTLKSGVRVRVSRRFRPELDRAIGRVVRTRPVAVGNIAAS